MSRWRLDHSDADEKLQDLGRFRRIDSRIAKRQRSERIHDADAATAAQYPHAMAENAVSIGYDMMNGKKPAQELILIPVQLITKKNVADYKGWSK